MTSFKHLRWRLERKLREWPEHRRNETAFGGLTWGELADRIFNERRVSRVKALVRQAEREGLV